MADVAAVTRVNITATDSSGAAWNSFKSNVIGTKDQITGLYGKISGLASLLAGSLFANAIREAIDYADHLNDLSQSTGISVETLGALGYAGRQSGTDLEAVAKGSAKLANQLAAAAAGQKESRALFDAMGISITKVDGSLIDTDEALFRLADRFASYKDGPEKAALANAYFGDKLGAQMIPLLNLGGTALREAKEEYLKYGGVTTATAERADAFNDTLEKSKLIQGALTRTIAAEALPVLQKLIDNFVESKNKGDGFRGTAEVIVTVFKGLVVGGMLVGEVLRSIGSSLGAIGAIVTAVLAGNFKEAAAINREANADLKANWEATTQRISEVWNVSSKDVVTKAKEMNDKGIAPTVRALKDAKGSTNELDKALGSLEEQQERGLQTAQHMSEADKVLIEFQKQKYQGATLEQQVRMELIYYLAQQRDRQADLNLQTKAAVEADKDGYEWMLKLKEAYDKSLRSARDMVEALQFEIRALTMTNVEREIATKLRELERLGIVKGTEAYDEYAEKIRSAVETKEALQNQITLWQGIEGAAHDAFTHIFEGGRSVFERLAGALKSSLLELLYQMTVKRWILSISTVVTGNAGIANALGGNGTSNAAGNLLTGLFDAGSGSSLLGFGGLGGLFSGSGGIFSSGALGNSFALSGAGQALGLSAAGLDAAGGVALTELGVTLGAAIPVIGAIAGVLLAANAAGLFGSKGGPKQGGTAGYGAYYPGETTPEANAAVQKVVDTANAGYASILAALGGKGTAAFTLGYDTDPEGTAQNRVSAGATVNGQSVYSIRDIEIGRDSGVLEQRLALEAKRSLLAALQASDLPADVAAIINSITAGAATAEAIDRVLAYATALSTVNQALAGLDDINSTLDKLAGKSALDTFRAQGEALDGLLEKFDGSVDQTNALAAASSSYYTSLVQLVAQIRSVQKAVDEMFAGTRDQIYLAGRDNEFLMAYYTQQIEAGKSALSTLVDPAQIQETARQINDALLAKYGLLDAAGQASERGTYLQEVDQITASVDERLNAILTNTTAAGRNDLEQVRSILKDTATELRVSVGDFKAAVAAFAAAASTERRVRVDVGVQDQRTVVRQVYSS